MDFLQFLLRGEELSGEALWKRLAEIPDEEIGKHLLAQWLVVQAADLGIPIERVDEQFAERVRQDVLSKEATTADGAAVEKVLHKAAIGEFAFSGKLIREYLVALAVNYKFVSIGIGRSKQASDFGKSGAEQNKLEGQENEDNVLLAARSFLAKLERKTSDRSIAKKVAKDIDMPLGTVRGHLTKLRKKKKLD